MDIHSLNLEKFTGYGSKVSRRISINKSYGFSVPRAFLEENNLLTANHVELFFDREAKVIGIQFKEGEGGFKLVSYGRKDEKMGVSFAAKSFFNTYKVDVNLYAGPYEVEKKTIEGVGDVFLLQLKERAA